LDGAGFYYGYVDKQLEGYRESIFGSLPALVSIPKSRIEGGELTLFWKPSQAIKINIGATYIHSEVTSDFYGAPVFASSGSATVDYKGMAFPFTPKWAATSDVQYDIPVSSRITGFLGGGLNYHSSTTATFAGGPLLDIDSFTLLDLRAGVKGQDDKWSAALWGRNVTDRYYWNDAKSGADVVSRTAGMPRTVGITVSGRF
jgi:iron complex outermembrane recepter protein